MSDAIPSNKQLQFNVQAHNWVADRYEKIHGEIYNKVEQQRLHVELEQALQLVDTHGNPRRVLDLGCGAGNLTAHLLSLGNSVIAADVSPVFLRNISKRFKGCDLNTLELNGTNLSNIDSESLDMIATYSVLHHVPDYLEIVDECMRVLKPGGVLYIDHEVPDGYWAKRSELNLFYRQATRHDFQFFRKYLHWSNYVDFLIRKFKNPRYRREGDIHVFEDDHIEWDKIRSVVQKHGIVMLERDYLLFRSGYREEVYDERKNILFDMKVGVYRKAQSRTLQHVSEA